MRLMYSEFAANLLRASDRIRPNRALRLALLGPSGSGKREFSRSIEEQLRVHPGRPGDQVHVRIDAGEWNGFEFDDAHARILVAMRAAVEKKTISKQALDTKDATINFVPDVRALLSECNAHLF